MSTKTKAHVPHYPTYENARAFLKLIAGQSRRTLLDMRSTIHSQTGTPQDTRVWTNPDDWIPEVLEGGERKLAEHLWTGSKGLINPRHLTGEWLLCSSYQLIAPTNGDILQITEKGQEFLSQPQGNIEQNLDANEGLLELLTIVAQYGPGKRGDLLPHFEKYLLENSRVQSPHAMGGRWHARVMNLVNRQLVSKKGNTYQITDAGIAYLDRASSLLSKSDKASSQTLVELARLKDRNQAEISQQILGKLTTMDAYDLERLVGDLLEKIGYENVTVTKRSRDGGIDVIGDIRVGITHVREVVQVKRHKRNLSRELLDQVRGAVQRFGAYRGTIITTGGFVRGLEQEALAPHLTPITLIDGNALVDLMIEHELGVKKRPMAILEFDASAFEFAEDDEVEQEEL